MMTDAPSRDVIVFDGLCVACSRFARFMARHDKAARFGFVTAQSELGRTLYRAHDLDPDIMDTNIIILDGTAYVKMRGVGGSLRYHGRAMVRLVRPAVHPDTAWELALRHGGPEPLCLWSPGLPHAVRGLAQPFDGLGLRLGDTRLARLSFPRLSFPHCHARA